MGAGRLKTEHLKDQSCFQGVVAPWEGEVITVPLVRQARRCFEKPCKTFEHLVASRLPLGPPNFFLGLSEGAGICQLNAQTLGG